MMAARQVLPLAAMAVAVVASGTLLMHFSRAPLEDRRLSLLSGVIARALPQAHDNVPYRDHRVPQA